MPPFRNPDGTYNGIKILAEMTGLSEDEIRWTFDRSIALRKSGMPKDQVAAKIKSESANKPWKK